MVVWVGSKYYGHYKMTPPPPQLQNTRCYLACPVCTFEWFIHICHLTILFPCLNYIKLLVDEGGGGGGLGGGGQNIMAIIK